MAVDDDIGAIVDERGDTLEAIIWGGVFLFTLLLFLWEFGLGAMHAGEGILQPIGEITRFAQTMWLSGLIGGGGVVALIVYAVFRFSSGVRDAPAPLLPGQGSLKFTMFTLAVLAIVGTTIFVGASTLAQTDEAGVTDAAERYGVDQEVELSVVAAQWFWRFDVAGVPGTQAEQVVVPADTIVQFETTSADVIHSVAIKELGITKDALPGQTNQAWFYVGHVEGETDISVTGPNGTTHTMAADTYEVQCAELCGKGHSQMLANMYVVEPGDYRTWVEANGGHPDDVIQAPTDGIQIGANVAGEGGGHDDSGDEHDESGGGGSTPTPSDGHSESEDAHALGKTAAVFGGGS
jgi:cytochrome c oxidase subunit 2